MAEGALSSRADAELAIAVTPSCQQTTMRVSPYGLGQRRVACCGRVGTSMRGVKSAKAATGKRRNGASAPDARRELDAVESALAMLAHEIRTPLNGILALSELIAAADLPQREREWASLVKSAAEHLAQLATLVVDGVRAEARGLVLRDEPFRLRALAEAVGGTLAARAGAKDLAADISDRGRSAGIRRRRPGAAARRAGKSRRQCREVHRSRGIAFAVEAKRGGARAPPLTFSFTDSGVGMTRAEIAKLFRPFGQASSGGRAPLRRRRARSGVREAARRGDGRHAHGHERGRARQHLPPDRHARSRPRGHAAATTAAARRAKPPARAVRRGQSLCPRRAEHDPDRARPSRRLRRHRRGRGRGGRDAALRRGADGRDPAGPRRPEATRAIRALGGAAGGFRSSAYQAAPSRPASRPQGGRDERLSCQTGQPGRAGFMPSPRAYGTSATPVPARIFFESNTASTPGS